MGAVSRFIWFSVFAYIGMSLYSVFSIFMPKYCATNGKERCYTPLWTADHRVDLYFYSSETKDYTSFDDLTPVRDREIVSTKSCIPRELSQHTRPLRCATSTVTDLQSCAAADRASPRSCGTGRT